MSELLAAIGNYSQPYFLLCVRLFWGWQFVSTGLGKLADIGSIGAYFGALGIPYPLVNAYVASGIEVIGGACFIVGFAARLFSLPLMGTMIVALMTAHREATLAMFYDPINFISQLPFTFLFAALTIFVFGPGKFAVDREAA